MTDGLMLDTMRAKAKRSAKSINWFLRAEACRYASDQGGQDESLIVKVIMLVVHRYGLPPSVLQPIIPAYQRTRVINHYGIEYGVLSDHDRSALLAYRKGNIGYEDLLLSCDPGSERHLLDCIQFLNLCDL